jgi:hypothetical protein
VSGSRIFLVKHRTRYHVVRENANDAVCTWGRAIKAQGFQSSALRKESKSSREMHREMYGACAPFFPRFRGGLSCAAPTALVGGFAEWSTRLTAGRAGRRPINPALRDLPLNCSAKRFASSAAIMANPLTCGRKAGEASLARVKAAASRRTPRWARRRSVGGVRAGR